MLLHADIRMISPFLVKFFKSAKKVYKTEYTIGLISPNRIYQDENIKVIWGTGNALKQFCMHISEFKDENIWYDYIMESGILAEWGMFNYMNMNEVLVDCADKCNYIGYAEWMLNRYKIRIKGDGNGI